MTVKQFGLALLGGVSFVFVNSSAHADELRALKAQLEALQSRVNVLEATPEKPVLPDGYSYLTYSSGQGSNADWDNWSKADSINQSASRGFTVAITPSADLPAPIAEVSVYGYVKGDVIYSFEDDNFEPSTSWPSALGSSDDRDHITLHAKQSRFGITSKVDTAVGQIKTLIEGDFEGPRGEGLQRFGLRSDDLSLRHAYGEWQMTENLALIVGQTWRIASLLPLGVTTVNHAGPFGAGDHLDPQVKLRYSNGPLTVRLGIEEPITRTVSSSPVFGGSVQYDIPGGHTIIVGGSAGEIELPFAGKELTHVLQGGVNVNIAELATLTGAVVWGEGPIFDRYTLAPYNLTAINRLYEAYGLMAGVSVPITGTTTFNAVWAYLDALHGPARAGIQDELHTVHANIIWQPVDQMRMGWEVLYLFADDTSQGLSRRDETVQLQWGTWFFF